MGIFGPLEYARVEFLAWCVFALGIPLFKTIGAIETGPEYRMKDFVKYWTIFSLIYLFELASFVQWIPFWSGIKLMFTLWLVFSQFHGACYAYDHFISPCVHLMLREFINRFDERLFGKIMESQFINFAENFIDDHGFDALEKLIAAKKTHKDPYVSESRDLVLNQTVGENDASAISKQTAKWKCTLCKVETTSESNLNDHLQGSKHKAISYKDENKTCKQPRYENKDPPRRLCFKCELGWCTFHLTPRTPGEMALERDGECNELAENGVKR